MLDSTATVLLVEDEEAHAELVARAFERSGAFDLKLAASVSQARDLLETSPRRPDLIITDFRLPDGSGTDLLDLEALPVIIITSHGDQSVAVEAMKAGAFDYVVKSEATFSEMPHIAERSLREWRLRLDRDRIERERRRSDELLRLALADSPVCALTQAPDLRITWAHNPPMGLSADAVLGKTDYDLFSPDSAERLVAIKREVLESGEPAREEVRLTVDEEMGVFDLSLFPDRDAAGTIVGVTCISFDVTERKRLEEELAERERLASVGMAASILAHEIGNPLNNMFLVAQTLERRAKRQKLDEGMSEGLRNMMGDIRRLNGLLSEFRALSRRESLSLERVNLGSLLESVLGSVSLRAEELGIRPDLQAPPELVIEASPDKLVQVFINLCKNAIEAMPDGGTLTVRVTRDNASAVVEIIDTGSGIEAGLDVFQPFKTTKTEGTGLGLSIVRQIVTAHGGHIRYTSAPGEGTTFRVVLPDAPPARVSERPPGGH